MQSSVNFNVMFVTSKFALLDFCDHRRHRLQGAPNCKNFLTRVFVVKLKPRSRPADHTLAAQHRDQDGTIAL